jgi:hypothetical protein
MSRSTDRERARLNEGVRRPSTDVRSGLTTGHGKQIITAGSDEEERIKLGIIGAGNVGGGIAAGLTYGSPAQAHEERVREQERTALGHALLQQERLDAHELSAHREADLLEAASEAINGAALEQFTDPAANLQAAKLWEALSTEQRAALVATGGVAEYDADVLHQRVWPAVLVQEQHENAQKTQAAGSLQKGLALMRLQEERGLDGAAWDAHKSAVVSFARDNGIVLADERMGSVQFEDQFRAAEIAMAEIARADAVARFQADVLNETGTNVSEGLRVLGPMGYVSTIEGAEIEAKPDFQKAGQRVLGGLNGDPMYDSGDDIRKGIVEATSPTEGREWSRLQEQAGKLFDAAEEARIAQKLGER